MYERFYENKQYKANFTACSANKSMKTCFLITEWPELHVILKTSFGSQGYEKKNKNLFFPVYKPDTPFASLFRLS